jgi:hypothetical protein
MTQYHADTKDDGDLSGFFLNSPQQNDPKKANRTRADRSLAKDEDLSGFLIAQPRPSTQPTDRQSTLPRNNDDLSGCLAAKFTERQPPQTPKQVGRYTRKNDHEFSEFIVGRSQISAELTDRHTTAKSTNSDDLSGCLSSSLLGASHADRLRRAHAQNLDRQHRETTKPTDQTNDDDDDLSGCLASGFLKPKKPPAPPMQPPAPVKPIEVKAVEVDDDPKSGWMYYH